MPFWESFIISIIKQIYTFLTESKVSARGSLDMSVESDAIISSPVSKSLSKDGVNKVLSARFDTTTGIFVVFVEKHFFRTSYCYTVLRFTVTKLPRTALTNYFTTLQERCHEEQKTMTTPWA